MSFTEKRLNVTIQLGKGSFGASGFDTVRLENYRVSANIVKGANPSFDSAELRIFNLSPTLMNQISTLGRPAYFDRLNQVSIEAGDETSMTLVYTGIIREAFQDFSDAPNAGLNITSNVGLVSATKPIPPSSYPGTATVASVAADLAARMTPAVGFENHGVDGVLQSPYFPGTALQQLRALCEQAHINATIDNDVLVIWPKNGSRDGAIPDIGPDSGMIGYPQFSGTGFVRVSTLFVPGLQLNGDINLTTSITPAGGRYRLNALTYQLESQVPGGKWQADFTAYRPDVTG